MATKTEAHNGQNSILKLDMSLIPDDQLVNFHGVDSFDQYVFRWTNAVSMVHLDLPVDDYIAVIETENLRPELFSKRRFKLYWDDNEIPHRKLRNQMGQIWFKLSKNYFRNDTDHFLTISAIPREQEDYATDRRTLGMPIAFIDFLPCTKNMKLKGEPLRDVSPLRKLKRLMNYEPSPTTPNLRCWRSAAKSQIHQMVNAEEQLKNEGVESLASSKSSDVIVSAAEINSRHGTGLLIQYLFEDVFSELDTITGAQLYDGDCVKARRNLQLPEGVKNRTEIYRQVLDWFEKSPPNRAYVVPYYSRDLIIALALKDLFGTKICLHIMDDHLQPALDGIPLVLFNEAIQKADIRFAISADMRNMYHQRFGEKFYVLPPIVPEEFLAQEVDLQKKHERGILIGNIWDQQWLDLLRKTVKESGLKVDWFCNSDSKWLKFSPDQLAKDGIFLQKPIWGMELCEELRTRPYLLMPSGNENKTGADNIAKYSLPSRVPFAISTAHLPVVVLGDSTNTVAKFVQQTKVGKVIGYQGHKLKETVDHLLDVANYQVYLNNCARVAPIFSAKKLKQWIWNSVAKGEPEDNRFELLFKNPEGDFAYYIEHQVPQDICWDKRSLWLMMKRLKGQGYDFEQIFDVGASDGIWSAIVSKVFPNSRYVLFDPLIGKKYTSSALAYHTKKLGSCQLMNVALSNKNQETSFFVSDDFYGSSLLHIAQGGQAEEISIETRTIDSLNDENDWNRNTLLKIDVQFAEHLVLQGAQKFIAGNVTAILLELTLEREHQDALTYREMLDFMDRLGFKQADMSEGWRNSIDGKLEQLDVLFLRK